jgi:CxxC motif-containing protein
MKEMICIVCPNGCRLGLDRRGTITGYQCERGRTYAEAEMTNPTRVLTTTVRVKGGIHRRCSVKTEGPIPKGLLVSAVKLLDSVELSAPVECGQIVVGNLLNTGVNLITTRTEAEL